MSLRAAAAAPTVVSQEVRVGPLTGEQTIGFEFRYAGGLFA